MYVRLALALALALPLALGACASSTPFPEGGLAYEVHVASFADADGDGTGDLAGLADRLDYLVGLGVRVVRLSTLFPSAPDDRLLPTATDGLDPRLGDTDDLHRLHVEARDRDLLLLAGVEVGALHASHPAFVSALAGGAERAAFRFGPDGGDGWWPTGAGDYYYAPDGADAPRLDWSTDAPRALFGLESWEVDGFAWRGLGRDAAAQLANTEGVHLADLGAAAATDLADLLPATGEPGVGLLAHPLRPEAVADALRLGTADPLWEVWSTESGPAGHWVPSTGGSRRYADLLADLPDALRAALVVHLLLPGLPELRYGDEWGVRGTDEHPVHVRFPWEALDDPARAEVEPELSPLVRALVDLRQGAPVARLGHLARWDAGPGILAFQRTFGQETLLVLVNLAPSPSERLPVPPHPRWVDLTAGRAEIPCEEGCTVAGLPGHGYAVLGAGLSYGHDVPPP